MPGSVMLGQVRSGEFR